MLARLFAPTLEVHAHCDLPCGVYDPAQARIEAESIKAIIAKVADNDDPDFRTRAMHHQGAALRAGQAPPLGAVDRLLQAAALREVPAAAHAVQRGHQARRRLRHQGLAWTPTWPTSCSPRSTRSPRSSPRPRRLTSMTGAHAGDRRAPSPADGQHHSRMTTTTSPDVELRLPADSAYLAVLRTATAGLAARINFTLDDIEDLRIAVDEACAILLPQAAPGLELECRFWLGDGHDDRRRVRDVRRPAAAGRAGLRLAGALRARRPSRRPRSTTTACPHPVPQRRAASREAIRP